MDVHAAIIVFMNFETESLEGRDKVYELAQITLAAHDRRSHLASTARVLFAHPFLIFDGCLPPSSSDFIADTGTFYHTFQQTCGYGRFSIEMGRVLGVLYTLWELEFDPELPIEP